MTEYAYKAVDTGGKKINGFHEAAGYEDLEHRLESQGYYLINAKVCRQGLSLFSRRKIQRRQIIVLFMYLEQMADTGISILDSLIEMRNSEESAAMRHVIGSLVDSVSAGKMLSDAMQQHPEIFTELIISLIRAGEQTGDMARVLLEIKNILSWQDDVARKTKKLLSYPLFVGGIVFCVICFLMIYLVPQLVSFISSMNQEIPLITRALIVVSDCFVNYWLFIIIFPVAFFLVLKIYLKRSPSAKYYFDYQVINIPLFGEAFSKLTMSRFSRSFALLYDSGISILDCLEISSESVSNVYIKQELDEVREKISGGLGVHDAFSTAQVFPPLVLRMLNVGEQTGELGKSIIKVSDFYSRDVTELIDKIQLMIEPTMTVIMGVLLGWIMLAVLGPIYDIISSIQM